MDSTKHDVRQRMSGFKHYDLVIDAMETARIQTKYRYAKCQGRIDFDELWSAALQGLWRADVNYDKTRGSFLGFASMCVRQETCRVIKRQMNKKNEIFRFSKEFNTATGSLVFNDIDAPIMSEECGEMTNKHRPDYLLERKQSIERAKKLHDRIKESMTDAQKRVYDLHLDYSADNINETELAKQLGVSRQAVNHRMHSVKANAKRDYINKYKQWKKHHNCEA